MKRKIIISLIFSLVLLFLIIKPQITGELISENNKLGYCPTMYEEAMRISEEKGYEMIAYGSASKVLSEMKDGRLGMALIGRKAKLDELNLDTKETILKSGYTLVSNKKDFIDYSQLSSIDIYTYLDRDFDFSVKKISKEDSFDKINEGKIALISWDDWNDNFEIIVVMNGNEKVKDFRGTFLYKN